MTDRMKPHAKKQINLSICFDRTPSLRLVTETDTDTDRQTDRETCTDTARIIASTRASIASRR